MEMEKRCEKVKSNIVFTLSEPREKNGKAPAIFLMHGMGSNENDLPNIVQTLKNDYYIFSLRGPISQGSGYSFFTIERIGQPHQEPFKQILLDLQHFIEKAIEEYSIDENKIYLLGFSQGAILSQSLATILGSKLAGIVSLSGYLPKMVIEEMRIAEMDQLKVFIAHGEQDQMIPFNWSKDSKEFFESHGASVQYFAYTGGHFVTPHLVERIEQFFSN